MLYLFCITVAYARMHIFRAFTAKLTERGLDSDDDAADNLPCRAVPCRAVPCRAVPSERSFAALLCQAHFPKNIPKAKDHHAHGESPPGSAMVFLRFLRDLTPADAPNPYTTGASLRT